MTLSSAMLIFLQLKVVVGVRMNGSVSICISGGATHEKQNLLQ